MLMPINSLLEPALISVAYLLGSIPTALLVCHSMGIADPRQQGSGNPGTSNVLRIGNRVAAALTLAGDLGKGILAIWLAQLANLTPGVTGLCALAVVLGHLFPMLGAFRGGKGVATTLGCTLMLSWPVFILQVLTWLTIVTMTRTASIASLCMALITLPGIYLMAPELLSPMALIALLLIARHSPNIRNLISGKERRF